MINVSGKSPLSFFLFTFFNHSKWTLRGEKKGSLSLFSSSKSCQSLSLDKFKLWMGNDIFGESHSQRAGERGRNRERKGREPLLSFSPPLLHRTRLMMGNGDNIERKKGGGWKTRRSRRERGGKGEEKKGVEIGSPDDLFLPSPYLGITFSPSPFYHAPPPPTMTKGGGASSSHPPHPSTNRRIPSRNEGGPPNKPKPNKQQRLCWGRPQKPPPLSTIEEKKEEFIGSFQPVVRKMECKKRGRKERTFLCTCSFSSALHFPSSFIFPPSPCMPRSHRKCPLSPWLTEPATTQKSPFLRKKRKNKEGVLNSPAAGRRRRGRESQ